MKFLKQIFCDHNYKVALRVLGTEKYAGSMQNLSKHFNVDLLECEHCGLRTTTGDTLRLTSNLYDQVKLWKKYQFDESQFKSNKE